jgi:hypothetical protein
MFESGCWNMLMKSCEKHNSAYWSPSAMEGEESRSRYKFVKARKKLVTVY